MGLAVVMLMLGLYVPEAKQFLFGVPIEKAVVSGGVGAEEQPTNLHDHAREVDLPVDAADVMPQISESRSDENEGDRSMSSVNILPSNLPPPAAGAKE